MSENIIYRNLSISFCILEIKNTSPKFQIKLILIHTCIGMDYQVYIKYAVL